MNSEFDNANRIFIVRSYMHTPDLRTFVPEEHSPARLWKAFQELSDIPRLSGKEAGVRAYLTKWAARFPNARVTADYYGNLSVHLPGKGARSSAPGFLLQSHMDMVGIKDADKKHDFLRDGITLMTDGEHVRADRTTLGADNGLGVAGSMAFAEELEELGDHGPITMLFTAREETDNQPALSFDPKDHGIDKAIPYLVSLDGNTEGHVGIYCAGYQDIRASTTLYEDEDFSYEGGQRYRLDVGGHPGGHSGLTAHLRPPSATRTLFKGVLPLLPPGSRLLNDMGGGEGKSSWPKAAYATAWIPNTTDDSWRRSVAAYLREGVGVAEDALTMHPVARQAALRKSVHDDLMRMFENMPDGAAEIAPHGMQASLSSNLGTMEIVSMGDGPASLEMAIYVRGDLEEALTEYGMTIRRILRATNMHIEAGPVVPGCFTPPDAPLIQAALAATTETSGGAAPVGGHCFVEIGAIRNKLANGYPELVPQATVLPVATIIDEHSTRERALIASASRLLKAVRGTYDRLTTA